METTIEKNTNEIKKLTEVLNKRRKEESQRKKFKDDPSSLRQYLYNQTIGKIDIMRFLPPQLRTIFEIGKDLNEIFKAKKIKSSLITDSEIETESPLDEIVDRIQKRTKDPQVETKNGFTDLINHNTLIIDLLTKLLQSSENIEKDIQKLIDYMLFEKENRLENEREQSRLSRTTQSLLGPDGKPVSPTSPDTSESRGGFISDLVGSIFNLENAITSYFGLKTIKGGLRTRLGQSVMRRVPGIRRFASSPARTTPPTRRVPPPPPARTTPPTRTPKTPKLPSRFRGRAGGIFGAGLVGMSLYEMLTGDSTESYTTETGIESNPFAGGLDPNLITLAYGGEVLSNATGLSSRGADVTNILKNTMNANKTISGAKTAIQSSRMVNSAKTAMTAVKSLKAAQMIGGAGTLAAGGAGSLMSLAGGPAGLVLLGLQTAGQEYLARLTESNIGKSISLSGGVRRDGDTFFNATTGEPIASLMQTEGLKGQELADAQLQNAFLTSMSKLQTNTNDVIQNIINAKNSYENNKDDEGRIYLETVKDLLKYRVTLAAEVAGVAGVPSGSKEADYFLSLDAGSPPGTDAQMKQILEEMYSNLSWFEWVDGGKMSDTIELLNQTSSTAMSETDKSFSDIQERRFENLRRSQESALRVESQESASDLIKDSSTVNESIDSKKITDSSSISSTTMFENISPNISFDGMNIDPTVQMKPNTTEINKQGDIINNNVTNTTLNTVPDRRQIPSIVGIFESGFRLT